MMVSMFHLSKDGVVTALVKKDFLVAVWVVQTPNASNFFKKRLSLLISRLCGGFRVAFSAVPTAVGSFGSV